LQNLEKAMYTTVYKMTKNAQKCRSLGGMWVTPNALGASHNNLEVSEIETIGLHWPKIGHLVPYLDEKI